MKPLYLGLVGIFLVIVIVSLSLGFPELSLGFQEISTDKKIYSSGEKVNVTWSYLFLDSCSCHTMYFEFFKETPTGLERVKNKNYEGGGGCVDGKMEPTLMHCDAGYCGFPELKSSAGTSTLDLKVYEQTGTVNSCYDPWRREIREVKEMRSRTLSDLPAGNYKIKYGAAETSISIK